MPRAQSTRSAAYSTSASTIRVVVVGEVAVVRAATTTTLAMGPLRLCVKRNKKNALPDSGGRRSAQWRERDSPNSSYHLWFHRLTPSSHPQPSCTAPSNEPQRNAALIPPLRKQPAFRDPTAELKTKPANLGIKAIGMGDHFHVAPQLGLPRHIKGR